MRAPKRPLPSRGAAGVAYVPPSYLHPDPPIVIRVAGYATNKYIFGTPPECKGNRTSAEAKLFTALLQNGIGMLLSKRLVIIDQFCGFSAWHRFRIRLGTAGLKL
jgi:hypothetical protein